MTPQLSSLIQDTASSVDGARTTVPARRPVGKNTLPVVTAILRETGTPMSVRQIVARAGAELPTHSKTPDTVVARDLAMDIKKKGEASAFVRTSPGRFTLRELLPRPQPPRPQPPEPIAETSELGWQPPIDIVVADESRA
jgi:hypothetical protein